MDGDRIIISIGRKYGSGGREIGKRLAKELGIDFYDKELITLAAKESGFSEEILKENDENHNGSFLYSIVMGTYTGGNNLPLNHKLFLAQFDTIKKRPLRVSPSCMPPVSNRYSICSALPSKKGVRHCIRLSEEETYPSVRSPAALSIEKKPSSFRSGSPASSTCFVENVSPPSAFLHPSVRIRSRISRIFHLHSKRIRSQTSVFFILLYFIFSRNHCLTFSAFGSIIVLS